jgi:hypothetical protein
MIFTDGLIVLGQYAVPLLVFFVSVLGWGLWCLRPFMQPVSPARYLALALGIGIVALSLLGLATAFVAQVWQAVWKPASLVIVAVALVGWLLFGWEQRTMLWSQAGKILTGGLLFLILLVIRLIFIRSILLPPYHDSAEHYMLVQSLLRPFETVDVANFLLDASARYYHLGFHALAAWWVSATGLEVAPALALLGQVFLVICPFTVFALADSLNGEQGFAWFAALLAAIGWSMPAFAVNWGKYPALAAVAGFPAVVTLWWSARHGPRRKFGKYVLLLLLSAGLIMLHSRALVLLALAACGVGVAWIRFPERMPLGWSLLPACVILPVFYWLRAPLLSRYFSLGYITLLLVILGLPFAFSFSPRLSAVMSLFMLGIYAASVTKLPAMLRGYSRFLLDRPFEDISLFLPLSALVGLELAGFLFRLSSRPRLQAGLKAFFAGMILISFSLQGSLRADRCCNYVETGDLYAMKWIKSETAPDAIVLISGYEMSNYQVATDGGAWVRALTGRNVNKVRYDLPWDTISARTLVCKPEWNEPYIYAGGQEFSFDRNRLYRPEWYEVVFEFEGTRVYKVHNCKDNNP